MSRQRHSLSVVPRPWAVGCKSCSQRSDFASSPTGLAPLSASDPALKRWATFRRRHGGLGAGRRAVVLQGAGKMPDSPDSSGRYERGRVARFHPKISWPACGGSRLFGPPAESGRAARGSWHADCPCTDSFQALIASPSSRHRCGSGRLARKPRASFPGWCVLSLKRRQV